MATSASATLPKPAMWSLPRPFTPSTAIRTLSLADLALDAAMVESAAPAPSTNVLRLSMLRIVSRGRGGAPSLVLQQRRIAAVVGDRLRVRSAEMRAPD